MEAERARTNKRPIAITILGWLYLVTGGTSIARGAVQLAGDVANGTATRDVWWVLGSGVLAALGGAFLLRGSNWARWLCAAWMGGHIYVGYLHSTTQLVLHAVFLAVTVAFLWRPAASAYFARSSA